MLRQSTGSSVSESVIGGVMVELTKGQPIRNFLKRHRPSRRRQHIYDFIVAYLVPGFIWRPWARWYWNK